MKTLTIIFGFLLCNLGMLSAQDTTQTVYYLPGDTLYLTSIDSSDSGDTLSISEAIDTAISGLDTSAMTRSILLEKALLGTGQLSLFNGATDSVYATPLLWSVLHKRLPSGSVRWHRPMLPWDSLLQYHDSALGQGYLPIGIMNVGTMNVKPTAVQDSLLEVSGRHLLDVVGRPSSPYENHDIFLATPLEVIATQYDSVQFLLDTNRFYVTNMQDSIRAIEVDFGDGNGFVPVGHNVPKAVAYSTAGVKDVRVRMIVGGNTIDSLTAWSQINVLEYTGGGNGAKDQKGATTQGVRSSAPDDVFNVTAEHSYSGKAGTGNVNVWYGCNHTGIERPFVLVPGFDIIDTRVPYDAESGAVDIYSHYAPFFDSLRANGYDVIIVDYDKGADYIQRNAYLFEKMIKEINNRKTGDEKMVIMGESMGGLVARYALADMEKNRNEDPETRLYISFDSPHQGAYTPISSLILAEHADKYKGELTVSAVIVAIIGGILLGAVLGGVIGFIVGGIGSIFGLGGLGALSTAIGFGTIGAGVGGVVGITGSVVGLTILNNIEEQIAQELDQDLDEISLEEFLAVKPAIQQMLYFAPGSPSVRSQFLNDLAQVGYPNPTNSPNGIRKVAVTNGDIEAHAQNWNRDIPTDGTWPFRAGPGTGNEKLATLNVDGCFFADFNAEIWATPNSSQGWRKIFEGNRYSFPFASWTTVKMISKQCWECLSGGSFTVTDDMTSLHNEWVHEYTIHQQSFCFIPTVSALDIETSSLTINVENYLASNPDKTPFDAYYASPRYHNQIHTFPDFAGSLPSTLHSLLANEIYGEYDAYVQCQTIAGHTNIRGRRTITAGTNVIPVGTPPTCPVVVASTATGEWVAGKEIILKDQVSILAGSDFAARIDPSVLTSCVYTSGAAGGGGSNPASFQSQEGSQGSELERYPFEMVAEVLPNEAEEHREVLSELPVSGEAVAVPARLSLIPNPTSSIVVLHYELRHAGQAVLSIVNAQGEQVTTLLNVPYHQAGKSEIAVDVSGYAPGTYFCILNVDGFIVSEKLSVKR
ncbi:MAG: T9SS type A sorting domain-containing protein [Candidatus Kapaibacterium sp.]